MTMKRFLLLLSLLVFPFALSAQETGIPQILGLANIEENDSEVLQVFNMPKDGQNHYYLSLSRVGLGDDAVQLIYDPVHTLFLPLGDRLSDAMDVLQQLQDLYNADAGTSIERPGCLAVGFPNDELETVTITYRQVMLSRILAFCVEREGSVRAVHLTKSNFGSLMNLMKVYRKIHPNEE